MIRTGTAILVLAILASVNHSIAEPLRYHADKIGLALKESNVIGNNATHDNLVKSEFNTPAGKNMSSAAIYVPGGGSAEVNAITFSSDGKFLASAGASTSVTVRDVTTGMELKIFVNRSIGITSVTFSPNGKQLAIGLKDTIIMLWDVPGVKPIKTLSGHSKNAYSVAFHPNGKTVLSEGNDTTLKIWDITTGRVIKTLTGNSSQIAAFTYSPDGKKLAVVNYTDGTLRLWNSVNGKVIRTICETYGAQIININPVTFSRDGKSIIVTRLRDSLSYNDFWDVATGKQVENLDEFVLSPDGLKLAYRCFWHDTVKMINLTNNTTLTCTPLHDYDHIHSIAFHDKEKAISVEYRNYGGNTSPVIKSWDVTTGNQLKVPTTTKRLAVSPNGNTTVTWTADGTDETGFTGKNDEMSKKILANIRNQKKITVKKHELNILQNATGKEEKLTGHTALITNATFSPNGRFLVSASLDNTVKIWDARSWKLIYTIVFYPEKQWIAFGSLGRYASSAFGDRDAFVRFGDQSMHPLADYRAQLHIQSGGNRLGYFYKQTPMLFTALENWWDTISRVPATLLLKSGLIAAIAFLLLLRRARPHG